MWFIVFRR